MSPWGKADLHIHSAAGDGVSSIEELLDHVQLRTDLDVIAITDHDEVAGGLRARDLVARGGYSFEVVTGTEITTRDGHLLALYVERRFPMLRSLEATVEEVHAAGGVCVVPHPFSWLTLSVGKRRLLGLQQKLGDGLHLDGIELFNPTIAGRVSSRLAEELNRETLNLAETGGSDAHHCQMVGSGHTLFKGSTAADLRRSIAARETKGAGLYWTPAEHLHGVAGQQFRAMVVHPYRKIMRAIGREQLV